MFASTGHVELVFPYKDCVLEVGKPKKIKREKKCFTIRP